MSATATTSVPSTSGPEMNVSFDTFMGDESLAVLCYPKASRTWPSGKIKVDAKGGVDADSEFENNHAKTFVDEWTKGLSATLSEHALEAWGVNNRGESMQKAWKGLVEALTQKGGEPGFTEDYDSYMVVPEYSRKIDEVGRSNYHFEYKLLGISGRYITDVGTETAHTLPIRDVLVPKFAVFEFPAGSLGEKPVQVKGTKPESFVTQTVVNRGLAW